MLNTQFKKKDLLLSYDTIILKLSCAAASQQAMIIRSTL